MTKIYLVTNCYGDPNKVYIGKTKNSRENNHKKTYGKNIVYTYIDEVASLNRKDWGPIESYWIEQFRQWGFEVVNPRKKGGGGPEFQTEEAKRKIQKSANEREYKKEWTEKMLENRIHSNCGYPKGVKRPVEFGEKISHHPTRNKKISEGNKGKKKPQTGIKLQGIPKTEQHKQNISHSSKGKTRNNKPILQYDLKNNFIKEWPSRTEAKKWLGTGDIAGCLSGKQKQAGGYIWKFKK
jgi:CRISPR/Cas system-associated exonuclease Cas4 (RecB family)